jgi:3-deoxy-D-manno-octulosonate 8-phosphate phosphatase KdsC-like HAD superfamily phosphatase
MLQLAGLPVAVGNATPKLKAVAKHIVSSNAEDGAAEAIERFVLKIKLQPVVPATTVVKETTASSEGGTG